MTSPPEAPETCTTTEEPMEIPSPKPEVDKPSIQYAIDTVEFAPLRRRMYCAMPCAHLRLGFDYLGILLEAENADGEGFSVRFTDNRVISHIFSEGELSNIFMKEVKEEIGKEAAAILMKFFELATKGIGEFHVRCEDWDWEDDGIHENVRKYQIPFRQAFRPRGPLNISSYDLAISEDSKSACPGLIQPSTDFYAHFGPTVSQEMVPAVMEPSLKRFHDEWTMYGQVTNDLSMLELEKVIESFSTAWVNIKVPDGFMYQKDADTFLRIGELNGDFQELIIDIKGAEYTFRRI